MIDDERVEVRRYLPSTRRRIRLLFALGAVAIIMGSFQLGKWVAADDHGKAVIRAGAWETLAGKLDREVSSLRQQLVNFERGAVVDRKVIEEVRMALRDTRQNVAGLEEEIAFYRRLMDPPTGKSGLDIHGFELKPAGGSGGYDFKLVLQQVAKRHNVITGYATVTLIGVDEAGQRSLSLHQLSEDVADEKIVLRFRYFQAVEGRLTLPKGFQPRQILLSATTSGQRPQEAKKLVDWST